MAVVHHADSVESARLLDCFARINMLVVLGCTTAGDERLGCLGPRGDEDNFDEQCAVLLGNSVQQLDQRVLCKELRNDHVAVVADVGGGHCDRQPARSQSRVVRLLRPCVVCRVDIGSRRCQA